MGRCGCMDAVVVGACVCKYGEWYVGILYFGVLVDVRSHNRFFDPCSCYFLYCYNVCKIIPLSDAGIPVSFLQVGYT